MQASIFDFFYRLNKILHVLYRKKQMVFICSDKEKDTIVFVNKNCSRKVKDHPMFGMGKKNNKTVIKQMSDLRGR